MSNIASESGTKCALFVLTDTYSRVLKQCMVTDLQKISNPNDYYRNLHRCENLEPRINYKYGNDAEL